MKKKIKTQTTHNQQTKQHTKQKRVGISSAERPRQSRTKHRLDTTNSIYPLCKP